MTLRAFFILTTLMVFIGSCKIDPMPIDDSWREYEYFPIEIGKEWIYKLDSIVFDPAVGGTSKDTSSTFLREVVRDTFTDLTGEVNYILDRYLRRSDSDPWIIHSVWHTVRLENEAQRVENNLRFVKLIFPPKQGSTWDGNVYFDERSKFSIAGESIEVYKNWSYAIESSGTTFNLDGKDYPRTVTVVQADDENAIERRYSSETFAFDIGLIYKEMIILDTQNITNDLTWEDKAEKGFILRQSLLSHQ